MMDHGKVRRERERERERAIMKGVGSGSHYGRAWERDEHDVVGCFCVMPFPLGAILAFSKLPNYPFPPSPPLFSFASP